MKEQLATPTYAYAHNIKITWPYGDIQVDSVVVTTGVNIHGQCVVRGFLDPAQSQSCMKKISYDDTLDVSLVDMAQPEQPLFKGKIFDVHFGVMAGKVYATIIAASHTIDLDIKKQNRSWQNEHMTYQKLVETCLEQDHPGCYFIDTLSKGAETNRLFMQFEETDYDFFIRAASYLQGVIVPDITSVKPQFYFGLPEPVRRISAEDEADLDQVYLQIGDIVTIDDIANIVNQRKIIFDKGIVKYDYQLVEQAKATAPPIPNFALQGASLQGVIIATARNVVKIHLDIDKEQPVETAYWFAYGQEGNNVIYLMPEIGARAQLLFTDPWESAIAINAPRTTQTYATPHPQPHPQSCQPPAANDPGEKSLRTDDGKELNMLKDSINFNTLDGSILLSLDDNKGVTIISNSDVFITAKDTIQMAGPDNQTPFQNMALEAKTQLALLVGNSSIVMSKGEMGIRGKEVYLISDITDKNIENCQKEKEESTTEKEAIVQQMAKLTGLDPDQVRQDLTAIAKEERGRPEEGSETGDAQKGKYNTPVLSGVGSKYRAAFQGKMDQIEADRQKKIQELGSLADYLREVNAADGSGYDMRIEGINSEAEQKKRAVYAPERTEDGIPAVIARSLKVAGSDQKDVEDMPDKIKDMTATVKSLNEIQQAAAKRADTPSGREAANEFDQSIGGVNNLLAMCPLWATPKPEIVTTYSLCARDPAQTALVDLLVPHTVPALTEKQETKEEKEIKTWLTECPPDMVYTLPKNIVYGRLDIAARELEQCYLKWGTRNWPTLCQADVIERVFARLFGWLGPEMGERIRKAAGPISYLAKFIPLIQDMVEGRLTNGESLRVCLHLAVVVVGIIASAWIEGMTEGAATPLVALFWRGADLVVDSTISWVGDSIDEKYFTKRVNWSDSWTPGKELLGKKWKSFLEPPENESERNERGVDFPADIYYQSCTPVPSLKI